MAGIRSHSLDNSLQIPQSKARGACARIRGTAQNEQIVASVVKVVVTSLSHRNSRAWDGRGARRHRCRCVCVSLGGGKETVMRQHQRATMRCHRRRTQHERSPHTACGSCTEIPHQAAPLLLRVVIVVSAAAAALTPALVGCDVIVLPFPCVVVVELTK